MSIMIRPRFPAICISDDGALELVPGEDGFKRISTLALIDTTFLQDTTFFDSQGQHWKLKLIAKSMKKNLLTRLLANTFYNPLHDADLDWSLIGTFDISELKQRIIVCIQKDDDMLTQFVEGEVIQAAIDGADSFEEVMVVLNRFIFSVEE